MAETEVILLCYWNGCIKHGPDGVYYEGGTTPKKIKVNQKTSLSRLLDGLYVITGLDKMRSKFEIFGRYPVQVVAVSPPQFTYLLFPVVNDTSLETMLRVGSNHHPSLDSVEFYLEVKPISDDVIDHPAVCSLPVETPGSSLKRQKIQQLEEAYGYVDKSMNLQPVKLEKDNGLEFQGMDNSCGRIEDEANADEFGNVSNHGEGEMTDKSSGSNEVAQAVNLTGDLNNDSNSGVSKLCESSLSLDDHKLQVGLCFKDSDELKKAVDWCSINGQQKCVGREPVKDEFVFECVKGNCKWTVVAAKMVKHGLFEIIKYTGPHTCLPIEPKDLKSEFESYEIERMVRVQPFLSISELQKCWKEKFGYELETSEVRKAKERAMVTVSGNLDQSFEDLHKLMSALHSSNALLVDWKYDLCPNPKFASFCGMFWMFPQSIEGFRHCKDLIVVDDKDLKGEHQFKLMIASGIDAANCFFPLAFAVTKKVSVDTWRWFLSGIREKVTQRKGLCLITRSHRDILAVVNEPGSQWQEPWAYHRFCLTHLCSQFYRDFPNPLLKRLVEDAGSTSQKEKFDCYMENIKHRNQEAWKWLNKFPLHQWALAHDNGGKRYGITKINREALFSVCKGFQLADEVLTSVKERRKWSLKEDKILISAWLNTNKDPNKDPVVSNEQKADAFWKRIQDYFNSSPHLVGTIPRERSQCKQRWGRINDQVCKFARCFDAALREHRSSENDDDVMKAALEIFEKDYSIKFTLEHAWRELRYDKKWWSTCLAKDSVKEKRKQVLEVDGEEEVGEPEGRPIGIKAASKIKKSDKEEELSMLQGMLEIKEKISKRKLLCCLIAKNEPLSEMETSLKLKLMSEML